MASLSPLDSQARLAAGRAWPAAPTRDVRPGQVAGRRGFCPHRGEAATHHPGRPARARCRAPHPGAAGAGDHQRVWARRIDPHGAGPLHCDADASRGPRGSRHGEDRKGGEDRHPRRGDESLARHCRLETHLSVDRPWLHPRSGSPDRWHASREALHRKAGSRDSPAVRALRRLLLEPRVVQLAGRSVHRGACPARTTAPCRPAQGGRGAERGGRLGRGAPLRAPARRGGRPQRDGEDRPAAAGPGGFRLGRHRQLVRAG